MLRWVQAQKKENVPRLNNEIATLGLNINYYGGTPSQVRFFLHGSLIN
jgi:hypothetical protein